jgi:hypothetical protein
MSIPSTKTHIEPTTPRGRLNPKHITSLVRKKSRTIFGSSINDSKENEEHTYLNDIGCRGGEEFDVISTQGNIEEEPKPNLDQIIDNIQIELIIFVEPIVSITKPTTTTT